MCPFANVSDYDNLLIDVHLLAMIPQKVRSIASVISG